jgi:hypothetical protein
MQRLQSIPEKELLTVASQDGPLFAASITNLKSARTLALDDDLAVQPAQFDLADVDGPRFTSPLPALGARSAPRCHHTSVAADLQND